MTCDQFHHMPPLRHDRDPARSAVLAHIQAKLGCDLEQAHRTFHYLRNKGHLVFFKAGRMWCGSHYTPDETEAQFRARITAETTALRLRLASLERVVERVRGAHNNLADLVETRG